MVRSTEHINNNLLRPSINSADNAFVSIWHCLRLSFIYVPRVGSKNVQISTQSDPNTFDFAVYLFLNTLRLSFLKLQKVKKENKIKTEIP